MTALELSFSHFGIYVTDLAVMAHFYKRALLFTQTDEGNLGTTQLVFLSRDPSEHHQLILATGRPNNLTFNPINQISFRVPNLSNLRSFHDRLLAQGATDMQPATHGNAISIYCRDPEGNRLEIFIDTPWYCDQPLREAFSFEATDEEILAIAERLAKRLPKFKAREIWQAEMAEKMRLTQLNLGND
jgi:catechol 2,3-dioxygenase